METYNTKPMHSLPSENIAPSELEWSRYKKFGLRFAFIYFILFIVLLDWSVNPLFSYLYYEWKLAIFLDQLVGWTGNNIFSIHHTIISPYDAQHNDRAYIYLLYFIMAITAFFGAIAWHLLDKRRTDFRPLYYWLTATLRYYLAFTMFLFALEKFFKMQFPDLGLYTLTQPVGGMSPMSLAWAFYGYSYGYNIFIGMAECAALLLLFRRTMIFGALLTMMTLVNVMVVNFNYDVHAKMYPTALFLMACFLLLPQLKRLFQFFFTNQSVSMPVIKAPLFRKKWMNITKTAIKILLIGYFLVFSVKDYIGYREADIKRENKNNQAGLTGIYDVSSFSINQDSIPIGDLRSWQQIVIGGDRERIRLAGDSILFMNVLPTQKEMIVYDDRVNIIKKEQEIYKEQGFTEDTYVKMDSILAARQIKSRLQFELIDSVTLLVRGKIKNDSVVISARKRPVDVKDFRLMKSKFHWISEAANIY